MPERDLHGLLERFATCGASAGGGISRLCGSAADGEARDVLASELREAGASVAVDAVGNQFGLFRLSDRHDAPLVMAGSHLDSQTRAGRLDGTLGVAAALCIGRTLLDARRRGARFDADFCVVNWTNEEGARFRPSLLGSGTYAGHHDAAFALGCRDDEGTSLGEALEAIGYSGSDRAPRRPACYLELHVEQGTTLEEAGATIGIVTRNWGASKLDVVFTGEQAHTGPGRMERRRDALVGAAHAITAVRALADAWPGSLHTSVGRLLVEPNSANVVPARVELTIEIRSADDGILAEAGAKVLVLLQEAAGRARVAVAIERRIDRPIRPLPALAGDLLARCAAQAGIRAIAIDTVAGHDALSLLGLCPIGLFFVPSIEGISHNEREATATADLDAGHAVMLLAVQALCTSGGDPVHALARMPS